MATTQWQPQLLAENMSLLLHVAEVAIAAKNLKEFAERALPVVAAMAGSSSMVLYIAHPELPSRHFFHHGFQPETLHSIEELCATQFSQFCNPETVSVVRPGEEASGTLTFYPLGEGDTRVGLVGLVLQKDMPLPDLWDRLLRLVTGAVSRFRERVKTERQVAHLNTYLTVSSMLAQSMGLKELLEATLYCSMEAVAAEAVSVLLLDDEKRNLVFYQVEGPTKPVLMAATFPADKGIAGCVLQSQQSEVINDVPNDPRFYGTIDSQSSFHTRNMIAVPLIAGDERVGVLEVINKAGAGSFSEEEHLLLRSIAEEIAFAVRNAKVFEYLANSYCKQRQGESSCKGCRRPLGSWTPCVKYRKSEI